MERIGGSLKLSATDLVGHLNCGYLTGLDLAVAKGALEKPKLWDPLLEILWERGARHEQGFIDHLKANAFAFTRLRRAAAKSGPHNSRSTPDDLGVAEERGERKRAQLRPLSERQTTYPM
jgi:uncharacterized protein